MPASATSTVGPLLISTFIAIWLSASCVHLNLSYLRRTHDPWQWKVSLSVLTLVDSGHSGILCWTMYSHLVEHWGDVSYAATVTWAFSAQIFFLVVTALVVQLYYAIKLSSLYHGKIRTGLITAIIVLVLAQLAFGIFGAYSAILDPPPLFTFDLHTKFGWQVLSYLVSATACNLLIFVPSLLDARSPRFAVRSEDPFEFLSRMVVETGFFPFASTVIALAFLVAWNANGRDSGVWMAFTFVLPKLYTFSLLTSHNRGAEVTRAHLSTHMLSRPDSSLSDMFKGSPLPRQQRGPITASRIGTPQLTGTTASATPIADKYVNKAGVGIVGVGMDIGPDSQGWLRRTIQPMRAASQLVVPKATKATSRLTTTTSDRRETAMSISDYGEYFADHPPTPPPLPVAEPGRPKSRSPSSSDDEVLEMDKFPTDVKSNEGYSSCVEVSLSPRRSQFGIAVETPAFVVSPSPAGGGLSSSGDVGPEIRRLPISYGYF
ncbi:hypothetical protein JCM10212_003879 [Sporobolomyces blumeae]